MHDNDYINYITDALSPLGHIKIRKMFGGYGIYHQSIFFALVIDDVLYFKVDDINRTDYQAHGSQPFTYEGKTGKPVVMSYWQVPIDILEDTQTLALWARKAVAVAMRAKQDKARKQT